jgi:hypothetical protein
VVLPRVPLVALVEDTTLVVDHVTSSRLKVVLPRLVPVPVPSTRILGSRVRGEVSVGRPTGANRLADRERD